MPTLANCSRKAMQAACVAAALLAATGAARAASESVVYSFKCTPDACDPDAALVNVGGTLFGTTPIGGAGGVGGTVFSVTPAGAENIVYHFQGGNDGSIPRGRLVKLGGALYGTTEYGGGSENCGTSGCGTVFKVTAAGVETVVYSFKGAGDGAQPYAGLINVGGTLYGTTLSGGGSAGTCYPLGCGTVFKVSTAGMEKVVYAFQSGKDGAYPVANLINVDGTLYGTTEDGGGSANCSSYGCGTVFSVTRAGAEKVLYSFQGGTDGSNPTAGLVYVGGALYGTTISGGGVTQDCIAGCGTVFKVTPAGAYAVVHFFNADDGDGANPEGDLINVGGMLYGTTYSGGANYAGTVFKMTTAGAETLLHSFVDNGTDGYWPSASLLKVGGTFYSTTLAGGTVNGGTVFALKP